MSLIQEALKRQQQESGQAPAGETKPPVQQPANTPLSLHKSPHESGPAEMPPPPPPPLPVPETGDAPAQDDAASPAAKNKKNLLIIMGVGVLILLLGGGYIAYTQFMKPTTPPPAKAGPAKPSSPTPEKPAPVQPAAVTPAVPATPPVTPAPPPVAPAPVVTNEPAKPVQPAVAPVAVTPPDVTPAVPAVTTPPVAVEEPPVAWPALSVTGVVGKGKDGSAFINKQIVPVGETIEGVKLVSIHNQSVELEFKGKKQIVKVGTSTQ